MIGRAAHRAVPGLLAAAALLPTLPAVTSAQEAEPLVKSEVIRLLVSDTYGAEERQRIVRRSCLTFTPTEADMEDFRRLGASEAMLEILRECASSGPVSPSTAVQVPAPPAEVAVSPPAILEPADTGGLSVLDLPSFEVQLGEYRARPPDPPPDRDNLLARVEVPPRLRNPAEIQRMLLRSAPDSAVRRENGARCVLWVFVDATGSVREARIESSSGLPAFDEAALEAARSMEFAPGTTGSRPVGMWVQQTLSVRR